MTRRRGWWGLAAAGAALILAYAAARPPVRPVAETRFLMDTVVTITVWGGRPDGAEAAVNRAFAALSAVDREMARVPGSPLWSLNEAGGGTLSPALAAVLEEALDWARVSDGAFDPTVAPLLDLWDIPAGPHPPPGEAALDAAVARVGWQRVAWDAADRRVYLAGTALDLGGIAKGYALDRAAQALSAAGVTNFIVDAGGDLVVAGAKGERAWRVGIQDPRDPAAFLRVVSPRPGALVTSGDYERGYEWQGRRIHHILDPRSGVPAGGCRSVTVWAPRAVDADALATAVFVLGARDGLALVEATGTAEALVVDGAGVLWETPGFAAAAPQSSAP